ncbi:MAG: hypothetical protein IPP17_25175 [Bacteroidetes bacterium]|nr:hypothetical protein [Bacteroidota bacterium]
MKGQIFKRLCFLVISILAGQLSHAQVTPSVIDSVEIAKLLKIGTIL